MRQVILLIAMLPMMWISTFAQSEYFTPSAKDMERAAEKVTGKLDKSEAEVRRIMIKRAFKEYLSSPAVATEYNSSTRALATDSVKTISRIIRSKRATLRSLESHKQNEVKDYNFQIDSLSFCRDSLSRVLAVLKAEKILVDSLAQATSMELTRVNDENEAMAVEEADVNAQIEKAVHIKDAAIALRSQAASVVEQISAIETEAIRTPLDGDMASLAAEAATLLERNRLLISTHGSAAMMAQAEEMTAHVEVLSEYSRLISEARTLLSGPRNTGALRALATRLDTLYREHGLANPEHIDMVKTILYQLKN